MATKTRSTTPTLLTLDAAMDLIIKAATDVGLTASRAAASSTDPERQRLESICDAAVRVVSPSSYVNGISIRRILQNSVWSVLEQAGAETRFVGYGLDFEVKTPSGVLYVRVNANDRRPDRGGQRHDSSVSAPTPTGPDSTSKDNEEEGKNPFFW
jgi:hypothetical protein